jgi:Icc-related predicted phosphoesterase
LARKLTIYVAADLHGAEVVMKKFLNAGAFYGADVVIAAGDLTGKAMVPVVQRNSGSYDALISGRVQSAPEDDVEKLERAIRMNGFYPFRCDATTYDRLCDDLGFRTEVFEGEMERALREWAELAQKRLGGSGIRCFAMPGNDDGWFFERALEGTIVVNHDGKVIDLGDVQLIGFGPSNRTPWHTDRELDEEDIEKALAVLEAGVDPDKPLIVNTHVPPYGSGLDVAPNLREDLSIVKQGGEVMMGPVGSEAVRDFLHRRRPFLSLHGHIHESRGIVKVGKTLAVNPGSEYTNAALRGALITIEGGRVLSSQLVSG